MAASGSPEAIERLTRRIPGLRLLSVAALVEIGEILLLAHQHIQKLEPHERRRVLQLMRAGRCRRRNLNAAERDELATLVAKAQPRLFVGLAAQRLSPVPLPKRVVYGQRARGR